MVLQWPPNVCSNLTTPCARPNLRAFHIHGFWPHSFGRCSGSQFSAANIASIQQDMDNAWPDVINGNNEPFWSHEWSAHGRCTESQYDQLTYHTMAVNIWKNPRYNLLNILRPQGIVPNGQSKSLQSIKNAIQSPTKGLGKFPGVRCNINASTKKDQFMEMVLCFATDGVTLIDCSSDRCPSSFIW